MKDYLAHGDFLMPLNAAMYWLKHLFIWSFQTGAPNLDGIIRLPGRLLTLLVFQAGGNVAAAYWYLGTSFVICFVAFYLFSRLFLRVKSVGICLVGSLLFTFNPIFLGNLAKVGLIIAVAMLPFCLVLIQRSFERRQVSLLLLASMLLTISLIHPFTFTVNVVVAGAYFVYKALREREFMRTKRWSLVITAVVCLLMNAYFLLPLASLGTVNKEVLSQDITNEPVDYTALIDIANTGDMVTALSLSKNVLKDFEFYDPLYANVFFVSVFVVYGVLFGLYVYRERQLGARTKRHFVIFTGAFLLLALLSTGTLFHIDVVIKWLIDQPGGWMFRSPLKWQLYIPLVLFAALVMVLYRTQPTKFRIGGMIVAAMAAVGMNAYLLADIWGKLFTPRQVEQFAALTTTDLSFKTMLFVSSAECSEYARQNPRLFTELNQVVSSYDVQLKRVGVEDLGAVHMADYDYAMSCQAQSEAELSKAANFTKTTTFANGGLVLYQNKQPQPHVFAFDTLFALATPNNVNAKDNFVTSALGNPLHFVEEDSSSQPAAGVYDIFENLSPKAMNDGVVTVNVVPTGSDNQMLYVYTDKPLFYKIDGQQIFVDVAPTEGYEELPPGAPATLPFTSPARKTLTLYYRDPAYSFTNLMPNPSFEEGLWQREVGDCNRYDDHGKIAMSQTREDATDGQRSLQLEADRHIACTWTPDIAVVPGAQYLLSFDYQTLGTKPAAFFVQFDDDAGTFVSDHLPRKPNDWQQLSKVVDVPQGATSMRVILYAFADELRRTHNIARYDNFSLQHLPALQHNVYLVSQAQKDVRMPAGIEYQFVDPTKKEVRVRGASTPFYLAVRETFHDQWSAGVVGGAGIPGAEHMRLNNGVNGWYIDPAAVCEDGGCTKQTDGSYSFDLLVEFAPQKWLTTGIAISAPAWVGSLGYVGYDWWRRRKAGGRR